MENQDYMKSKFDMPYLKSVVFEIRFPSDLSIIERISEYQALVKEKFPNISEGILIPPSGIAIKTDSFQTTKKFTLKNENGDLLINISHNSVSCLVTDYQTYEHFREAISVHIEQFINLYEIKTSMRYGLRYFMHYDFENSDNEKVFNEFNNYFEPFWSVKILQTEDIIVHNLEMRKKLEEEVMITMRSKFNHKKKKYFYELDFDVYTMKKYPIDDYEDVLAKLRHYEKSYFLNSIKKGFLEKLGAKPS